MMRPSEITEALWKEYSIHHSRVLQGEISRADLANTIKDIVEWKYDGRFFFPDALYDSYYKRNHKAENRKAVLRLVDLAETYDLKLYRYRQFVPHTSDDSLYSETTIRKAKYQDDELLGLYPRIGKIERTAGTDGKFHIQGLAALDALTEYNPDNFKPLEYREIDDGALEFTSYLSKPSDQNVERDSNRKLLQPFPVALLAVADWYKGTLKNQMNGLTKNPRTIWNSKIPRN